MSKQGSEESEREDQQEKPETLCGDPDCPVCSSPGAGTCAGGFSEFVRRLNGGGDDE